MYILYLNSFSDKYSFIVFLSINLTPPNKNKFSFRFLTKLALIMPFFKERNFEMDKAFYYEEGTHEQMLRDSLQENFDKKMIQQAKKDVIFLHCLPAYYGYEVTKEVAHGPNSVIFDEAENRMWAQMSIILNLIKK